MWRNRNATAEVSALEQGIEALALRIGSQEVILSSVAKQVDDNTRTLLELSSKVDDLLKAVLGGTAGAAKANSTSPDPRSTLDQHNQPSRATSTTTECHDPSPAPIQAESPAQPDTLPPPPPPQQPEPEPLPRAEAEPPLDEDPKLAGDKLLQKIRTWLEQFPPPPPPLPVAGEGGAAAYEEVDYRHLTPLKLLGEGPTCRAYAARYPGGQLVAKVPTQIIDLDVNALGRPLLLAILREAAEKLAALRHDNIARLEAVCVCPPCMLTEYCSNRSLKDMLAAAAADPTAAGVLTWKLRMRMALDAARGMAFLHTGPKPVTHANLKSSNLLVTSGHRVKVADIGGNPFQADLSGNSSLAALHPHYIAPEILRGGQLGKASDVYAFGVVCWELLTWQRPWAGKSAWDVVIAVTGSGDLPLPADRALPGPDRPPQAQLNQYKDLMKQCYAKGQFGRPSFKDIVCTLE